MLVTPEPAPLREVVLTTLAVAARYDLVEADLLVPVVVDEELHGTPNCTNAPDGVLTAMSASELADTPLEAFCTCTLRLVGDRFTVLTESLAAAVPTLRWLRLAQETLAEPDAGDLWAPLWRGQAAHQLLADARQLPPLPGGSRTVRRRRTELAGNLRELATTSSQQHAAAVDAVQDAVCADMAARWSAHSADLDQMVGRPTNWDGPLVQVALAAAAVDAVAAACRGERSERLVWVAFSDHLDALGNELVPAVRAQLAVRACAEPGSLMPSPRRDWTVAARPGSLFLMLGETLRLARIPAIVALAMAGVSPRQPLVITDQGLSLDALRTTLHAAAGRDTSGDNPIDFTELVTAATQATT